MIAYDELREEFLTKVSMEISHMDVAEKKED